MLAPPRRSLLSVPRLLTIIALAITLIWIAAFRTAFVEADSAFVYAVTTAVAIGCIITVALLAPLKLWSGGFILILVIALFHVGLPAVFTFGWTIPERYAPYLDLWFVDGPSVHTAVWLCTIAMLAFTLGYVSQSWLSDGTTPLTPPMRGEGLAVAGLALMILGVGMYLGFIALTAPQLLLGQGGKRLYEATVAGSEPIAYGTIIVSIGSVMAAAAAKSRARTAALILFFTFTAITLAFGSRTAALYACVAVVVVIARVRKLPSQKVAIAAVVVGTMLVSGVQQFRDEGLASASLGDVLGTPASAASEMGLTLRPVVETVNWVEDGTTPLRLGSTYFAGSARIFESAFGLPRLPSTEDERFAGYLVRERVDIYQIGYSMVAEAYLNFGPYGMLAFFGLLGGVLGRWDARRLGSPLSAARYGVVFVALIAHVRQASNITLTGIILGLVAIEVASRLASPERQRRKAERQTVSN